MNEVVFAPPNWPTYSPMLRDDFTLFVTLALALTLALTLALALTLP